MTPYEYSISEDTLGQLNSYTLIKQISETPAIGQSASYINGSGDVFTIWFNNPLSPEQETALDNLVATHNGSTTIEQLAVYLDSSVAPFVTELINEFAAGNIAMGITQAGKSGHLLALFTKKYPVPNTDFQNTLKDSFDTGSLYVSRDIIQHIRDNSSEFNGLSPFVTDARLLAMKNKIETFLGLGLST